MSEEYRLGGEGFRSKEAIRVRLKEVLWGDLGVVAIPANHAFLSGLLAMHPKAGVKIGAGIASFEIRINDTFRKSRTIWVHRVDGTDDNFSYKECLQPSSPLRRFSGACRLSVRGQIEEWKRVHTAGRECWYCSVMDKKFDVVSMEVDHKPPLTFNVLVRDFIIKHGIDINRIEYIDADDKTGNKFAYDFIEYSWQRFHDKYAELWLLSKQGHAHVTRKRKVANHDRMA